MIIFNNSKITPAPFVSISRNYQRAGGATGEIIGSNYQISLTGTLVAEKGSPNSSGVFWDQPGYPPDETIAFDDRLRSILAKQRALEGLFRPINDGKKLEIQSSNGTQPYICYPRILDVTFQEGNWFNVCEFSIQLEADKIFPLPDDDFEFDIDEASESWSLDPQRQPENDQIPITYQLTHNVSATGKRTFDDLGNPIQEPWQNAKDWVESRLGIDSSILSSTFNDLPAGFTGRDHLKTEFIDPFQGQYTVNETWLLTTGSVLEDYSLSVTGGNTSVISQVSISGSITGLEEYSNSESGNISKTKYETASEYFDSIQSSLFSRAQSALPGSVLNTIRLGETVGRNPVAGTINYSYEYDTRPAGIFPDALLEKVSVSYNDKSDKFASVFVLGRFRGPVLQPLSTSDAKTKTLSVELVIQPTFDVNDLATTFAFPNAMFIDLVEALNPVNEGALQSFKGQPQKNYDPYNGTVSYSVEWTYE